MSRLTRALRGAAQRAAIDLPAILALTGVAALAIAAGAFHWALGVGVLGMFALAGAVLIARIEPEPPE